METVSFTQMKDGTAEDYAFLADHEHQYWTGTADRVLDELRRQGDDSLGGYKVSRLTHALQSATRALRDGADVDWIVGALLHDIGDGLAPQNHGPMAAEIVRPFVREEVTWVLETHGIFQMKYYAHHYGWNPDEREKFRGHPYFDACAGFCERWDQTAFDPDYPTEPLERFEGMVREVFARKAYDPAVIRAGVSTGLPEHPGIGGR